MSSGVDIIPKTGDVGDVGTSSELWGNSYISGKYYISTLYIGVTGGRLVINNGGGEQNLTYISEVKTDVAPDQLAACTDITTGDATSSKHGLMPKADKIKLDAIEAEATATPINMDWDEYTISSDAITISEAAMIMHIIVDTEGDAATDDLANIYAQDVGMLVIRIFTSTRAVTFKDGTGNLKLSGSTDYTPAAPRDTITLINFLYGSGNDWVESGRT